MNSFRVFLNLVQRDLKVLKKRALSIFFDNVVLLFANVILFGYLLPAMGMSKNLIGPLFVGYVVMAFFEIGFSLSFKIVDDIKFNRFIDYQLTLPISTKGLLAQYTANFAIEAGLITLPLLTCGILLLGDKFVIVQTNWLAFSCMYMLSLILFGLLFLFCSFYYRYKWFFHNIWPRRLEPLFLFGAVFVTWKKLYAFSHILGVAYLFNPMTYATEGIRATLIGGNDFLPVLPCMIGVTFFIVVTWFLLVSAVQKKLDLVVPQKKSCS